MSKPRWIGRARLFFGPDLRGPSAQGTIDRHGTMTASHPIIAVVDDDAAVRNSLKFSLEIDGFSVWTYANAEEFLRSTNLDSFQCLIVDQDMPRIKGLELVAMLRERNVEVPIVLITGQLTQSVVRRAAAAGIPVIEKPFLGNGLIELIRTATGGPTR